MQKAEKASNKYDTTEGDVCGSQRHLLSGLDKEEKGGFYERTVIYHSGK